MNKYTTIVEWEYESKKYTTLGNYDVLAVDLQHAEFVMDFCEAERVDIAVGVGEISEAVSPVLHVFDNRLN